MSQKGLAPSALIPMPAANVFPMIVAAGVGERFNAGIPKQYIKILDKTLLQFSVACLAKSTLIDHCLLVISAQDEAARKLNFDLPVSFAIGGAERWQSVQSGLNAIINAGAMAHDLVLIHDAARPAVPRADIDGVVQAAMSEPFGAILAAPVADTLKQSLPIFVSQAPDAPQHPNQYIAKTLDRNQIWQAQTPQVFRVGALKQALDHVAEHHLTITDEASAFEALNLPIRLVTGSRQNIKLTYPEDGIIIEALLSR